MIIWLMCIKGLITGFFVGDFAGVPYEFAERQQLALDPAVDITEFGTHNQPMGTWSDDSSMTWCLAEAILEGYTPQKLASKFLEWVYEAKYTANFSVFDVGIATRRALTKYASGKYSPTLCGGMEVGDNGNGSLMRISPLIVLLRPLNKVQRYNLAKEVSSITHAHPRSILACFWLCEYLLALEETGDKFQAYELTNASFMELFQIQSLELPKSELAIFERILSGSVHEVDENAIRGSGYVIHTLECVLWCFLNFEDYKESILKAINFGEDPDTVAAILGGIIGFHLGFESVPHDWLAKTKRLDEVLALAERLEQYYARLGTSPA